MSVTDCSNTFDQTDPNIISSSSVIWDGGEIPCLGICAKSRLTPLVSAIATNVCSLLDSVDISTITLCQKFINDLGARDKNIANLLQILFDYNCTLPGLLDGINNKIDAGLKLSLNLSCMSPNAPSVVNINSVFQLIIDTFCTLQSDYTDFKSSIIDTINNIVDQKIINYQNSLQENPYDQMFKGTTVIYKGNTSGKFDSTGKGIVGTAFEKWAICNGANGTKDRRGFMSIMATQNLGNNTLDSIIAPFGGSPVFPTSIGTKGGSYTKQIAIGNLPAHNHNVGITITDPGHTHTYLMPNREASAGGSSSYSLRSTSTTTTSKELTGITATGTISNTGSGQAIDIRNPFIADIYIEKIFD